MKCPNCSSEVPDHATVCRFCGMMLPAAIAHDYGTYTRAGYDPNSRAYQTQINQFPPYEYAQYDPRIKPVAAPRRKEKGDISVHHDIIIILLTLHIVLDFLLVVLLITQ